MAIDLDRVNITLFGKSHWFNRSFDFSLRLVYPVKVDHIIRQQIVPKSSNQSMLAEQSISKRLVYDYNHLRYQTLLFQTRIEFCKTCSIHVARCHYKNAFVCK